MRNSWPPEDSYGRLKRLQFVSETIAALRPRRILDFGCGSGTQLTRPLAEAFPAVEILAVDDDARSIAWARRQSPPSNLHFDMPEAIEGVFDLVIASEVLEHVERPDRVLAALRARLGPGGRLVVTVPNGYGSYEWLSLLEAAVTLSGARRLLRRRRAAAADRDTLAVSPHVNFFTLGELEELFDAAGLSVQRRRARTLLCGWLIDGHVPVSWNAAIADRLPFRAAANWMFELAAVGAPRPTGWRRGAWARLRKRLNERRWGLA
jgi:2-polyprenyl-3-methyl-5-hydroxy-6-metoxy-1,4-benzoquinol methylase